MHTSRWPEQEIGFHLQPAGDNEAYQGYTEIALKALGRFAREMLARATDERTIVRLRPVAEKYADIRFVFGTAYVPEKRTDYQNFVANVSIVCAKGDPVRSDNNGLIKGPVFINIGHTHRQGTCTCNITPEIVAHEIGHALGLDRHFKGFGGSGPAISPAFWNVLATLYDHPPATRYKAIKAERACTLGMFSPPGPTR